MLIFHEGMPRSGKSYAAMKDHIVPALAAGRKVYARLDGLNWPKIAELAGISEERCRELLIEVTEDQVRALVEQSFDKDALIVLDEAQNFWPQDRQPLPAPLAKFITEHGHHGYDVLLMGQVLKDVHKMWVNRVNRKVQFFKKDVVGKENEYKWVMLNGGLDGRGNVKFAEVARGDAGYDPAYFGTYKSHSDGTENKGVYKDERANVFNSAMFRKWLPMFGVVLLLAVGYLVWFFAGGGASVKEPAKPAAVAPGPAPVAASGVAPVAAAKSVDEPDGDDYIKHLSGIGRPRLVSVMGVRRAWDGRIQWERDGQLIDGLSFNELSGLGWSVFINTTGTVAVLRRGSAQYVVTAHGVEKASKGLLR